MRMLGVALLLAVAATDVAAQPFAYAASGVSASLYVIDTASSQRVATVSLPSGTTVNGLVVSRDGTRVYALSPTAGTVVAVNAQSNTLIGSITAGPSPAALALTSSGGTLYTANGNATVLRGATTASSLGSGVQINADPTHLVFNPDETSLYVAHRSGTLTTITTSSLTVASTATLLGTPVAITLNSAGTRLYMVDSTGALQTVDPSTGSLLSSRSTGLSNPTAMALSPNGQRIVITDGVAGTAIVMDVTTGQLLATLTVVGTPQSVAIHPSSTYAYVVGRGGATASVIDLSAATPTLSGTITLPERSERIALAPTTPTAATPQTGWWWNSSESGRGFSFETNSARLFFAWYMYASDATATWYPTNTTISGSYSGTLDQYTGGQTLSGSYRAASPRGSSWSVRAVFFSNSYGALVWPGGLTAIQRYEFVSGGLTSGAASGMPQTGWWWNPSEAGRGFFIEAQSTTLFLAGFTYDDRGEPV